MEQMKNTMCATAEETVTENKNHSKKKGEADAKQDIIKGEPYAGSRYLVFECMQGKTA